MKIKIKKVPSWTDLEHEYVFIDVDAKKEVGDIEFFVNTRTGISSIDYVRVIPEYRGKHVISKVFDDILCDMKYKGAKIVKLNADSKYIDLWKHFEFKETIKYQNYRVGLKRNVVG